MTSPTPPAGWHFKGNITVTHQTQNRPGPSRHNMYHAVHKGIRQAHCRLLSSLGTTDFTDDNHVTHVLADLRGFLVLGQSHLASEEKEIHTAIEERSPGATSHAHDDHEDHEKAFAELETLARAVEDAPRAERHSAGNALYRRYALFAAADLEHMHSEETELLATMQRLFSDDELRMIEGRIVAAFPPARMMGFLRMIMPALNPPERLGMLTAMKAGMPPAVFDSIMADAVRPSLAAGDYRHLEQSLMRQAA